MNLCAYKDALGKPGQGIHSYRLFGVAIVDVLFTIFAAIIIAYFSKYNFVKILISLFILGIILHRLFCVRTTVDKLLFPYAR
jgi:hypothetical protein